MHISGINKKREKTCKEKNKIKINKTYTTTKSFDNQINKTIQESKKHTKKEKLKKNIIRYLKKRKNIKNKKIK